MPTINMNDEYFPSYVSYVYRGDTSGVFPANYEGRCADCNNVIRRGEKAQYVRNQFGHPIGGMINAQHFRLCQMRMTEASLNFGGSVTDINARVRAAETALSELYVKQEAVRAFGKDAEYPDSAVLLYKPYGGYWRSAVKVSANCWHLTASSPGGYGGVSTSWDRLVEMYLVDASEVWFGTEFERLK